MPLQMRRDQSAGLGALGLRHVIGGRPVAVMQGRHQLQHTLRRGHRTRGTTVHTHAAARGHMEGAVRARGGAPRTFADGGCPSGNAHGAQEVCVENKLAGALLIGDGPQRTNGEAVQGNGRGPLLTGDPLGGFQDGASGGVPAVVTDNVRGEGVDGLHLGDDVQIAPRMQLHVDMREGFQPRAELTARAAHPLGYRAHQPVLTGQQGHDAIGLAELVLPQHDSTIPIKPHSDSFPSGTDESPH
ncbi:Uncharacterised protein [Mycobacteroides abscessus subsp. abscessus]|nr:Uncharacterised protein [Mycobacteroides abscessus subsp. abscessus]